MTGLLIYSEYLGSDSGNGLRPLNALLNGKKRTEDDKSHWEAAAARLASLQGGKTRVEAAIKSMDGQHLAISCESKTLFGLRSSVLGALYDLHDGTVVGRVAVGKRENNVWLQKR
jgi:hypothetical protein